MKYLKTYILFEDVNVDRGNLQRLKDHFSPFLDDMKIRTGKDMSQIFDDNFIGVNSFNYPF